MALTVAPVDAAVHRRWSAFTTVALVLAADLVIFATIFLIYRDAKTRETRYGSGPYGLRPAVWLLLSLVGFWVTWIF